MKVYLIRHGETLHNRKHIHQDEHVPLAPRGRAQIERTAEALKKLSITKLITSDLVRAKQSAEIIGKHIGLVPEENKLFREVRRPSVLFGRHHFSPITFMVGSLIAIHLADSDWHHSDEENVHDLDERVSAAITYLSALKSEHEHIAVVSHSFIINLFLNYMCAQTDVRIRDYMKILLSAKRFGNASITTVTLADDANPHTCDWLCLDYNNRLHLTP